MAAPQSSVPPRVKPSRSKRRFTVEQANSTLPLVSRIVADVVKVHQQFADQQSKIEEFKPNSKQRAEVEKVIDRTRERLVSLAEELQGVGAELKDPEIGLIDFIGRHQGRDVYLCWKLGEARIGFWHELDAGAPGRQAIETLEESEKTV